jgi:hypothetical protein
MKGPNEPYDSEIDDFIAAWEPILAEQRWNSDIDGFGAKTGSFWLGLETLHLLTAHKNASVQVDLEDWNGEFRQARYSLFRIMSE